MKRNAVILALLAMLGLLAVGCQRDIAPTSSGLASVNNEPMTRDQSDPLAAAVTVQSATLTLYVTSTGGETVEVHRATAPWLENTVTWNSFAGAYDPTIVTTFVGAPPGFVTVDITSLVQGWMDGTYPNYGLYLKQAGTNTFYRSSEDATQATRPKIEICIVGGGCTVTQRGLSGTIADAYISLLEPDRNEGAGIFLSTGYPSPEREKGSLIHFVLPDTPPELAELGDRVWYDNNMDGIQNAGENGVGEVTVRLLNCQGVVLATTQTNASGFYLFTDLPPGNYNVEFVLPEGYVFTNQDQGSDDAVDSDANVVTGRTICTNLVEGESDLTWDAGIYRRPQTGCTRTIGYWKTHAGFGPQRDRVTRLLPIWLGTAGGAKSVQVTTALQAVQIFECSTTGGESNGIAKLMRQLLGAKLNIASGASNGDVASVIAAADAFLATHNWMDWDGLSDSEKEMVLDWHSALDDYNNGYTGPGHCN